MIQIVMHIVTGLHRVEDHIILNDVDRKLFTKRKQDIHFDSVRISYPIHFRSFLQMRCWIV